MMEKYKKITALKLNENLIPIWELNLKYEEDKYYHYLDSEKKYLNDNDFIEVDYDIIDKKIITPIVLKLKDDCNFKINDDVIYHDNNMFYTCFLSKIINISYKSVYSYYLKGFELDKNIFLNEDNQNIIYDEELLYKIDRYSPIFHLENGKTVNEDYLKIIIK